MDEADAYSNLILDNTLSAEKLEPRDRAFITAMFYGVLERKMTIDYLIRQYSQIEYDKIDKEEVQILRMGIYQLLYMDGVPDSAAVNECVSLCRERSKGFVNAVLRAFLRNNKKLDFGSLENEAKLSVEYSCARWMIKMWQANYDLDTVKALLISSFNRPPLYIKINAVKYTAEEVITALKNEGINAEKHDYIENCLLLQQVGGIENTSCYKKGMLHVQDISSQICCKLTGAEPGEKILDLCAAPGGKTFTIAEMMNNEGALVSCDLYENRLSLIAKGAKRLGLSIIKTVQNDGTIFNESLKDFDRVLCDVPCSGLGVIRRKPEIKYKAKKSIETLPEIQKTILENASKYVKIGGRLIYSTCTINRDENEAVVEEFLAANPNYVSEVVPVGMFGYSDNSRYTFLPHITGGDGFFVAILKRVN